MKKNVMMRIASILMICVLVSTCGISGTFAKYVSTASATDTARVAMWGVELSVSGEGKLFDTEYNGTGNAVTVKSQTTENLVAPGTADSTGITFTLKGKPEVATKVVATLGTDDEIKDVFLKNDGETYYPVVFTLTHTYKNGAFSIADAVKGTGANVETDTGKDVIKGTLAQINAVLKNLTGKMTQLAPGYPFDDEFTLTWAWAFGDPTNNNLDTKLGNIAAGVDTTLLVSDYCLKVAYNFSITIEQID